MKQLKESLKWLLQDTINSIEVLADWYLSTAYVARGEKYSYVVRTNKWSVSGYEYPWDIETSYKISHFMQHNASPINSVKSYGVVALDNVYYHVQQYVPWVAKDILEYDESDIIASATLIAEIHTYWKQLTPENSPVLYYRWRREYLWHHETILSLREQEERKSHLYHLRKKIVDAFWNEYVTMTQEVDIQHRITMLHWDFWHNNILFSDKKPYLIDFSRIPFWDPGIDVGHFIANLDTSYFITKDIKFLKMKKTFFDTYRTITWDDKIEKYCYMSKLHVWFITVSSVVQRFLGRDDTTIENYIAYILSK
jgi:thiamine kinase-like enzyme